MTDHTPGITLGTVGSEALPQLVAMGCDPDRLSCSTPSSTDLAPTFVPTWLHLSALHESGHALVALNLGMALHSIAIWAERRTDVWRFYGICTWEQGYENLSRSVLRDRIAVIAGGSAADSFYVPTFAHPANFWADSRYVGDAQRAQENFSLLTPTPATRQREKILAEEWARSRRILEERREGLTTFANALLVAFHLAREAAKPSDNTVRAQLSGREFCELVERVSAQVSGRSLGALVQPRDHVIPD